MTDNKQPLGITDVILRDAHQSILATRMRLDDMLPIAGKLDQVASGPLSPGAAQPLMPVSVTWGKIRGSAFAP